MRKLTALLLLTPFILNPSRGEITSYCFNISNGPLGPIEQPLSRELDPIVMIVLYLATRMIFQYVNSDH